MSYTWQFESTLRATWESRAWDELFTHLAKLECPPRILIRAALLTSQFNAVQMFSDSEERYYTARRLGGNDRFSLFLLEHRYGRVEKRRISGRFFIAKLEREFTYLLTTISDWSFWNLSLLPFVKRFYPRIVRVFLSQSELHQLLRNIRPVTPELGIRILKVSSRRRLRAKGARRPFETDILWTDKALETALREAAEENIWFRSVTFDLVRTHDGSVESTGIQASLSKYGSMFCNSFFQGFFKSFILPMSELASEKMHFFMNRERRRKPELPPRSIVISFDRSIFRTAEDAKRFVSVMRKMNNTSCSVLHANPYVHLSLVDNVDGSSAHIWVLKENEVLIVPQIKTSEAALKRIVNYVFEEWREGSIRDLSV